MPRSLVPIRVTIGLKPNGHALYPDFNTLASVQASGMDWSRYVDIEGIGWHYDKQRGHKVDDLESPFGQQFGVLIVPKVMANEAIAAFPTVVVKLTRPDESLVSGLPMLIRTHLLWDISASVALTVELWRPVRTAIAIDCDLSFVKSKYKEVIIQPHSTPTAALVGVNAGDGAVDGRFGWVQTKGVCKVLGDTTVGALLVGEMVTIDTTVDGAVGSYDEDGTENLPIVGRLMNFLDGAEWQLVDLSVE